MCTWHRKTVAGIIFRLQPNGEKQFLIVKNIFNHHGLVGGGINRNEIAEGAMFREMTEEVGIKQSDIINIFPIKETIPLPNKILFFKIINQPKFFIIQVKPNLLIKTNWEIKEATWLSIDEVNKKFNNNPKLKNFFNQIINCYVK